MANLKWWDPRNWMEGYNEASRIVAKDHYPLNVESGTFNPRTQSRNPLYDSPFKSYSYNSPAKRARTLNSGDLLTRQMRPPNSMEVKFEYRAQGNLMGNSTTLSFTHGGADPANFEKHVQMTPNDLYKHDFTNGTAPESIPMLNEYSQIWNRALVTYVRYKVTFVAGSTAGVPNAGPFLGYILFLPAGATTTGTTATGPSLWKHFDASVASDANAAWGKSTIVGLPNNSNGTQILEFGKYLPDVFGNQKAYLGSLQQVSATNGNPDFSQPLSNPLTKDPNSQLAAYIGILSLTPSIVGTTGGAGASVDTACTVCIQAELTTKLYRSGLIAS